MRIVVTREVDRSAEEVWAVLTDWERQGDWMPATTVRASGGAQTDDSGAQTDDSGAQTDDSGAQTDDSGAQTDDSGAQTDDSGAQTDDGGGQGSGDQGNGQGVGGRIEAWTGIGRLGFLDTMVITSWDPPRRCDVMHTGRIVRGPGSFIVTALDPRRCRLTWEEDLEMPFGRIGRATAWLIRPLARAGLGIALRRFSRYVRRNPPGGR
ncbi:hypothetical protein G1H11_22575 [Phytoactinopolyspora alkaliphila]|uniref:SRPBCC family protein n=1 Tax=Phytoactinopolyspora alkaliphila TaxID=1783498 RepID=A0A6N9YTC6_9ACTN|nr:hypothetical protein [Phytoactinopolyspora alkaliphila]NED98088.1 hypothetical protein [Phytoactinopolyspora alkaliphila]